MRWTPEEEQIVKAMWSLHATPAMIAKRLSRATGQVHDKIRRLDLPRHERKPKSTRNKYKSESSVRPKPDKSQEAMRRCLGTLCGNLMFKSDWPGHRICRQCADSSVMRGGSLQDGYRVLFGKGTAL